MSEKLPAVVDPQVRPLLGVLRVWQWLCRKGGFDAAASSEQLKEGFERNRRQQEHNGIDGVAVAKRRVSHIVQTWKYNGKYGNGKRKSTTPSIQDDDPEQRANPG